MTGPGGGNLAGALCGRNRSGPRVVQPLEDVTMSRVNAFARVRNDAGRSVSVGGRGSADSVSGWFNVDTAAGEVSCSLRAECAGHGLRSADRRRKSVGDGRRAVFTVTLPDLRAFARPELVEVRIRDAEESARGLLGFGAALVAMREAFAIVDSVASGGDTEKAAAGARRRTESAAALVPTMPPLPRVTLPGGVDMAEAAAALAWVRADSARSAAFDAARIGGGA